jgi:predicted naringenin-chalcone synthase
MSAKLLAISTAIPPHPYSQEEVLERFLALHALSPQEEASLKKLYQQSGVSKRHSVVEDFKKSREEWHFWGEKFPEKIPSMTSRNLRYKQDAPKLAKQAAEKVIAKWGRDPAELTHIISVSCTGVLAPGIEFLLIEELGLSPTINRLGINFMGCFGAFKGLTVAKAFALENPKYRILLICTELCSLHMQIKEDLDTLVGNSLFADGSAAAIIGSSPVASEKPLAQIDKTLSFGLPNSTQKMSWEASDHGFLMRLCHTVPVYIKRHIHQFVQELIDKKIAKNDCHWAIHPGGKSIIQAVERALLLEENQTRESWEILSQYGNLSSATFLFVLEQLYQRGSSLPWTVGLGFGPGLSFEGILLRNLIEIDNH